MKNYANFLSKFNAYTLLQIISISILLSISNLLIAEGVHQASTSDADAPLLNIANDDFGNFAQYDGPEDGRLYVTLKAGECLYLGLSVEANSLGTLQQARTYDFRIKDPNDQVVHGPFSVDAFGTNVTSYDQAVGPVELGFTNGYGTLNFNQQEAYKFCAPADGDYYIEFENNRNTHYIKWWDFTVGDANNRPVEGRVWSRVWGFRTPANGISPYPECFWNGEFNAQLYSYTDDGFVSNINLNGAGFQGLAFTVAFNSFGAQQILDGNGDLDIIASRQSVQNSDLVSGEHKVFLSPPDPTCFLSGTCGMVTLGPNFSCTDTCIEIGVNEPGQVDILIDFNQNGIFDEGIDITLARIFRDGDLSDCIPWDGLRADGAEPGVDNFNIITTYSQGVQHWSASDVEFLRNGFCVENVRPICDGSDASNKLFWDDSNIPDQSGTGQPNVNLDGCECGVGGCRSWNNFDPIVS
ncbi:MAG: hypothetical protein AAGK97_09295 [Bacteroidota bacterium]